MKRGRMAEKDAGLMSCALLYSQLVGPSAGTVLL